MTNVHDIFEKLRNHFDFWHYKPEWYSPRAFKNVICMTVTSWDSEDARMLAYFGCDYTIFASESSGNGKLPGRLEVWISKREVK